MYKKYVGSAFVLALISATHATSCPATEFSGIVAFGSSLTDGGNVFIASPPFFEGKHVPPSPPYHEGRFSNGPNYVDVLAELLDVPPLGASLNGGTNYAYGAATSGWNVLDPRVVQVDEQVSEYLAENKPRPDQLFVFGAINDFNPNSVPRADPIQSAAHMRKQIELLVASGAKHFLVGDLPRSIGSNALKYNQEFHRIVGELRSPEVSIYQFDLAGTIDQIIANPTAHRITNTTSPACRDCGSGTNLDANDIVDNPDEYLLWDRSHYTAPVNQVMGHAAFDATHVLLTEDFGDGEFSDRGFADGGLDNWRIVDSSSEPIKPWGPGIVEVQDGVLQFRTTGEVLPRAPEVTSETGFLMASLERSDTDTRFSNGFFRATVRANTASDTNVLLRGDPATLSGYVFTGMGPVNEFRIFRFENGDGELLGQLNGPNDPEFTLGDDWVIEAGAIGDEISIKVWQAGDQEPSEPQLVIHDDVLTAGQIGFAPAISTAAISKPTRLDVTYDDVQFRFAEPVTAILQAGDSDQDLDFDQLNLVKVQTAAKYLTEQSATWGEGDWNGAPGGSIGSPPIGDGLFNQMDIIAALGANTYLTGPYSAIMPEGTDPDDQTLLAYGAASGMDEVAADLSALGPRAHDGHHGEVDMVYKAVPEPSTMILIGLGLVLLAALNGRKQEVLSSA